MFSLSYKLITFSTRFPIINYSGWLRSCFVILFPALFCVRKTWDILRGWGGVTIIAAVSVTGSTHTLHDWWKLAVWSASTFPFFTTRDAAPIGQRLAILASHWLIKCGLKRLMIGGETGHNGQGYLQISTLPWLSKPSHGHQIMLFSLSEQTMRAGDVDDTRRYPVSWVICHTMWTTLVSSCQRVNVNRE